MENIDTKDECTFLYPSGNKFPFDEVALEIVKNLEARNWLKDTKDIGIVVEIKEYDIYASAGIKYKYVRRIEFDFTFNKQKYQGFIYFCRDAGSINWYLNNISNIHTIGIPKKEINVYDDESGPTFFTYVGTNWEKDKISWHDAFKSCEKKDGKQKSYLKYEGSTAKDKLEMYRRTRMEFL